MPILNSKLLIILPNEPDFATEMITTPNIYSGGPTFLTWTGLFLNFELKGTFSRTGM